MGADSAWVVGSKALRSVVMGLLNDITTKEEAAFAVVLDQAKAKLVEAGKELLAAAKDELDGLTVTVMIKVTKN